MKTKPQPALVTATPKTVRHLNRATVFDLIRENEPLSRADLARLSGMHRSNISIIVDEFLREGLLREERACNFGRGRTPDLLSMNRNAFRILVVSLRRLHTTVAIANLAGYIENSFTFETPKTPNDFTASLEDAYISLLQNASSMESKSAKVKQIVISIPGIADRLHSDKMTVWIPALPKYSGVDLEKLVQKRLGLPVVVANNSGLAAISLIHDRDKTSENLKDFVLLVVGDVGVGSGLVIRRNLYSGFDAAYAGEVGHTVVNPKGPRCTCGRSGCWQLYISDEATWKRYKPGTPFTSAGFEGFLDEVLAGSSKACSVLRQTAEYLSIGISNIALTLNPERIILAGALTRVWSILEKELQSAFFLPNHHALVQATTIPTDTLFLKGAVYEGLNRVLSESNNIRVR